MAKIRSFAASNPSKKTGTEFEDLYDLTDSKIKGRDIVFNFEFGPFQLGGCFPSSKMSDSLFEIFKKLDMDSDKMVHFLENHPKHVLKCASVRLNTAKWDKKDETESDRLLDEYLEALKKEGTM